MYNFRLDDKIGLIIVNILPQSSLIQFYQLLRLLQPHNLGLQNDAHTKMLHVLHEDSHEDGVVDKLPMALLK